MARSRDISKVLSSSTDLATDSEIAATYQTKSATGLNLISSSDFSGVSSKSIDSCFSATYENYLIVCTTTNASAAEIQFRLRSGGIDASGANYNSIFMRTSGGTTAQVSANTGLTFGGCSYDGIANNHYFILEIFKPFLATKTGHISKYYNANNIFGNIAGEHQLSNSYDSIILQTSSGNFSGRYSLFGYNK